MNKDESNPIVSVIVPARNEEGFLGKCLDSLLAQTYPPDRSEIIVVDNRSTDHTHAIAESYAARDPRVRVLTCGGPNQAAGMNAGIVAARGTLISRVDAHGHVEPNYLARVVAAFARHPRAVAVGGPYLPACDGLIERVAALARSSRFGVGGGWYSDKGTEEHAVRTVGCPTYRRDAVLAAGLFDPAMVYGEDDELNWRMLRGGGEIVFVPGVHQYNRPRATLMALAVQYWNYGRGRVRVVAKHPDYLLPRHLVPSLFVVTLILLSVSAGLLPAMRIILGVFILSYTLSLLAVGLAAARHGWREALLVPIAVALMHVAYGTAMLCQAASLLVGSAQDSSRPRETVSW